MLYYAVQTVAERVAGLRGIFRKRGKLLDHLFSALIESLRDWMRARLE